MSGNLQHKAVGSELTQVEYEVADGTVIKFASQAVGDMPYASSTSVTEALVIGSSNQILIVTGGIPAWASNIDVPGTLDVTGAAVFDSTVQIDGAVSGANVLDEDDMSSDSDTSLATQQSIKAYVDTQSSSTFLDKTADQLVTASTVLVSDTHLTFSVDANSVYAIWGTILVNAPAAAGTKFQWSIPGSGTADMSIGYDLATGGAASIARVDESGTVTVNGSGLIEPHPCSGVVITDGTSGTAVLQWAQQTSDASPTTLLKGSWLSYRKVA